MIRKYVGNPGSGKTTTLINAALSSGVPWSRILFSSFTRASVDEARERARARGASKDDLKYFCTLHALAKRLCNIESERIVGDRLYTEFAKRYGYKFSRKQKDTDIPDPADGIDDFALAAISYAASLNRPLLTVLAENVTWRNFASSILTLQQRYSAWKKEEDLLDFNDLIHTFVSSGAIPNVELAIFDEMQDASPLLWKQVDAIIKSVPTAYIAGDHNQALFGFQGAQPELFRDYPADETVHLSHSWRVPKKIAEKALAVIRKNDGESQLAWTPSGTIEGAVRSVPHLQNIISGIRYHRSKGIRKTYFLLSRVRYLEQEAQRYLELNGIPCGGFDKEPDIKDIIKLFGHKPKIFTSYDVATLIKPVVPSYVYWKRGSKEVIKELITDGMGPKTLDELRELGATDALIDCLTTWKIPAGFKIPPEMLTLADRIATEWDGETNVVRCMTIHESKGSEADFIFLLPGITKKIQKSEDIWDVEAERRAWYTALTRARECVIIVENTPRNRLRTRII